jgi:hypothetical protein
MSYVLYCIEGHKEVQNVNVTCRPKNYLPMNVIRPLYPEFHVFAHHSIPYPAFLPSVVVVVGPASVPGNLVETP